MTKSKRVYLVILPSRSASRRLGHFDRIKCALEFFVWQKLFFPRNLANRSSGLRAFFGNFSGPIVTDLWRKAGDHCHRKFHQLAAALFIRRDAAHTFLTENIDGV